MAGWFASGALQFRESPAMKEAAQPCIAPAFAAGLSSRGRGEAVNGFSTVIGRS